MASEPTPDRWGDQFDPYTVGNPSLFRDLTSSPVNFVAVETMSGRGGLMVGMDLLIQRRREPLHDPTTEGRRRHGRDLVVQDGVAAMVVVRSISKRRSHPPTSAALTQCRSHGVEEEEACTSHVGTG